jgi:uncharacterized repeat protein (TIGR03803 family)
MRGVRAVRGTLISLFALLIITPCLAQAQTYTDVQFTNADGGNSFAGLITDGKGHLFGTGSVGGALNNGTVFQVGRSGQTVLYSFTDGADGAQPTNGLIRDAAGNLYGMTTIGGDFNCSPPMSSNLGCGTVFKLTPAGQFTVLHAFAGAPSDGAVPSAGGSLVLDAAGNLYGTTGFGGTNNGGTVFKVSPAGHEAVIYSFGASSNDALGANAGLLLMNNSLYGTSEAGGAFGYGTIFKIDSHGNETIVHSFNRTDGQAPNAPLARDPAGNLYGTTGGGGADFGGTVFEFDASGTLRMLYSFMLGADGEEPAAPVTRDSAGNLYGTTWMGGTGCGPGGCGTLFKLSPSNGTWIKTTLHDFTGNGGGANPEGTLLLDGAGNVYGTTLTGGASTCFYTGNNVPGCGVAFKLTP